MVDLLVTLEGLPCGRCDRAVSSIGTGGRLSRAAGCGRLVVRGGTVAGSAHTRKMTDERR